MAQTVVLKKICPQCQGDGWYGSTSGPGGQGPHACNWLDCAQTGYVTFGKYTVNPGLGDLQDKHQDILDKLDDIIELLTP